MEHHQPDDVESPPRKRVRLSPPALSTTMAETNGETESAAVSAPAGVGTLLQPKPTSDSSNNTDTKERRVGIEAYVRPDVQGFEGILKQRYTDFLVNEILPNGEVCHLKTLGEHYKKPGLNGATNRTQNDVVATAEAHTADKSKQEPASKANGQAGVKEPGGSDTKDGLAVNKGDGVVISDSTNGSGNAAERSTSELNAQAIEAESSADDISAEDEQILTGLFGDRTSVIIRLYKNVRSHMDRKARDFSPVLTNPLEDRQNRTLAHQAIRRIFSNHLETATEANGAITVRATPPADRGKQSATGVAPARNDASRSGPGKPRGKLGWSELGGEHLHFTIYKENKDTMEVIGFITSQLRINPKSFDFAGTKDRRAVTVQRASVRRVYADQLRSVDKKLRFARIGDFDYRKNSLELGDLAGNEFTITLRDCHFLGEEGRSFEDRLVLAQQIATYSVEQLAKNGFINYYGLQRFGTFAATTDEVGVKMLQQDYEGAVKKILDFDPKLLDLTLEELASKKVSADDRARAAAISVWNTTGKGRQALDNMPRKYGAESAVIRHLSEGNGRRDFQGALKMISRNLRLMYVHAYQSLVWNKAATRRWNQFGPSVIAGDLVLVKEHRDKVAKVAPTESVDQAGEEIVLPAADDSALTADDEFERARALTAEEADSGKYSIFDIVLPQPGWDIEYPANVIGEYYKEFMASEEGGKLDPHNMRRGWKDISLAGGYRKLLAKPGADISAEAKAYVAVSEQLVETDLQVIQRKQAEAKQAKSTETAETTDGKQDNMDVDEQPTIQPASVDADKKIAIVVKLQLGSSTYATMALRELMKSGIVTYKPDFSGRGN